LSVNVCCEPKLAFHPPKFDRHVPALDIAGFLQALTKRRYQLRVPVSRPAVDKPNHRRRRLLQPCRELPHGSRPAQPHDELSPPHWSFLPAASSGGYPG
jgi:hypothetical protein